MRSSNSSFSAATYSSTYLKRFWQKLREVRKVLKVHLLTLLKKRLFSSSLCLCLPSPPSPTQISAQDCFLYVSLCSGTIKTWSKVCWNERKNLDFRIFLFIIWMNTGSCSSPWEQRQLQETGSVQSSCRTWRRSSQSSWGRLSLINHRWTSSKQNFEVFFFSLEMCLTHAELEKRGGFLRGLLWRMCWKTLLA